MEKKYKVVVFDFDGTLTYKQENIWKAIWEILGFDVSKDSYYAELFTKFMKKEITHQKWCDLTCAKFQEKGFSFEMLNRLADNVTLLSGIEETLKTLKDNKVEMFVVSGNIRQVILRSFENRDIINYFNSSLEMQITQRIYANNVEFDRISHTISHIKGTTYDFEGKAHFVEELKRKTGLTSKDILYVCDDDYNDKWVNLSCCDTLYINSDNPANSDKTKGPISMPNVLNLTQILPAIFPSIKIAKNELIK